MLAQKTVLVIVKALQSDMSSLKSIPTLSISLDVELAPLEVGQPP